MACNSTLDLLPDNYWKQTFGILMSVVSVTATIENAFLVFVICKFSALQSPSNKILASLAASDFLIALIVAPLHAVQLLNNSVMNNCTVDLVRQYLSTAFIGVATLNLGFFSLDRCLHLVKLRRYKMPNTTLYTVMFICWLLPMIIPLLMNIDESQRMYSVVILILGSLVIGTIVLSYMGLLYSLRKLADNDDTNVGKTYKQNEMQAGNTIVIVVTFYTVMLLPIFVHYALDSVNKYSDELVSKTYMIGMFSAVANSLVTPLVYCIRTPPLRKYIQGLFRVKTYRDDCLLYSTNVYSL